MAKKKPHAPSPPKRARRKAPAPAAEKEHAPIFVVHKHKATRLHYDFRLEFGGVLKSWAVPKGPSLDPRQKRLAVQVEDHPIEYAGFEGTIDQGSPGAGPVIIWDAGTYRNASGQGGAGGKPTPLDRALEEGFAVVDLDGQKLRGQYKLVRWRRGGENAWLLIKRHDAFADPDRDPTRTDPKSVLSGRTIEDLEPESA